MTKLSLPIVLIFAAVIASGCTEARPADLKPATPVKVHSVDTFTANTGLRYSATIRPAAQMELAFKNGGFVESIYNVGGRPIDKGNSVAKGTVLARVRLVDFQDRLDQANSQLREAQAS